MTPDQDLSAQLLSCPFCGGEAETEYDHTIEENHAYGCPCCGLWFDTFNSADAIYAWNTRAPTDHERAVQAAVAKAVEAEREACAWTATSFLVGDPKNDIPLRSPSPHEVAAAIRSRGVAG